MIVNVHDYCSVSDIFSPHEAFRSTAECLKCSWDVQPCFNDPSKVAGHSLVGVLTANIIENRQCPSKKVNKELNSQHMFDPLILSHK